MRSRRWSPASAPRPSGRPPRRSTRWPRRCRTRITSLHLRALPADFPTDIAVQLRAPFDSHADGIMYRQVLAAVATARGWAVQFYDARTAEADAAAILAGRAGEVLRGPRERLGPPWTKDHRTALAGTIVTGWRHTRCG